MDVKESLLSGRRARNVFVILPVVLALLCFITTELILPEFAPQYPQTGIFAVGWARVAYTIAMTVAQVSLTTLLVTGAYLILVPKDMREGEVMMVHSGDISHYLDEFLRSSGRYWFRGRSGRWVRNDVLPLLARRAAREQSTISVRLILPNPANPDLMSSYATYRKSIDFQGSKQEWGQDMVTTQVLATIVSAYFSASRTKLLDLRIGLIDWFSAYRIDITDGSAMLTVEDPKKPALRFAATSAMYRTYVAEMGQNLEHALILPPLPIETIGRPQDEALVIEILEHVGLEDVLGPEITAAGILRSVKEKHHPYG